MYAFIDELYGGGRVDVGWRDNNNYNLRGSNANVAILLVSY